MSLPYMKNYGGSLKSTLSIFGGLNRRLGAAAGELTDCKGLGANAYPALSPRAGRGVYGTYTSPTDIFEWDGHVVIVDGYNLLLDGKVIGNVSAGKKQFAVVNTRLVVWPDKVYYNFEDNTFHQMDVSVEADSADPSAYTSNTLALGESNVFAQGSEKFTTITYRYSSGTNDIFVYTKLYTSLSWDGSAWIGEGETESELSADSSSWRGKFVKLRANKVSGVYNLNIRSEEVIRSFSPSSEEIQTIKSYTDDMAELYAEIVSISRATGNPAPEALYEWTVNFRVISATTETAGTLSSLFEVGDWVTLKGVPGTSASKQYEITGINDETRTLTFPEDSFEIYGDYYYVMTEEKKGTWNLLYDSTQTQGGYVDGVVIPPQITVYGAKLPALPAGSILFATAPIPFVASEGNSVTSPTVTAWNPETGEVTQTQVKQLAKYFVGQGYFFTTTYYFTQGSGLITWGAEVSKGVPGMDFICAHNNRLYGVSNSANLLESEKDNTSDKYKTRIIYVSELGIPTRFNTFEGVDTDSYQVGEASNGDFTAAVSYGDHVLFFKEHKVVKFYGDYPSAMNFTYDDIEGVKAGCEKSLVIANEVLYYMGRAGMCAYTGTVPQIISYKLDREYEDVVCGTDGRKLLMCGMTDGEPELLSYNIAEGIWLKEENSEAKAMALIAGKIHMVLGRRVMIDGGGEETVEWSAEFHPFTEDTFRRKKWKYIRVRAEFEAGARLEVTVKIGDGEYTKWLTAEKTGWQTITVPLPLMRTDRIYIRLEGAGPVIVREVEREYQLGSDAQ